MARIVEEDRGHDTPCWIFTGSLTDGYGRVRNHDGTRRAHVITYEHFRGPIPDGLEPDHLCRVRACCNPWHIEPVTRRENIERSPLVVQEQRRAKTHCPQGHPYSGANLYAYVTPDGHHERQCRTCRRARG